MGKIEEITVSLPADAVEAVRKAVSDGEYASESEAIAAAVCIWNDAHNMIGRSSEDIAALWDDGLASRPGQFGSIAELIAEAERRQADDKV